MHHLMLQDRVNGEPVGEPRVVRAVEIRRRERVLDAAVRLRGVAADGAALRPSVPAPIRFGRLIRIDAAFEELLELRVDSGQSERALDERVDVERGQMPLVEADRVAQVDRTVVVRLRREEPEDLLASPPVAPEPLRRGGAIDGFPHAAHAKPTRLERC